MKALGILLLLSAVGVAPALAKAVTPQNGTDAPERASDNRDKMICKRFVETGSLVRGYRICKTKLDWERDRENIKSQPGIDSCRTSGNGGQC
ncbi:hypothetical protein [uncultured Sphingomonas sp.]|uniref:hypothetical protein n=1 Tax=uncultured Sphingomonas sp. TaxID=158754 RepID=UPI0026084ACB|nr:hypothetical protein [uncultured Sphingomonas sp.]